MGVVWAWCAGVCGCGRVVWVCVGVGVVGGWVGGWVDGWVTLSVIVRGVQVRG